MNMSSGSYCDSADLYLWIFCSLFKAVHVKYCSEFFQEYQVHFNRKRSLQGSSRMFFFDSNEGFICSVLK